MRAHYQAMVWNNCIDDQLPNIDPCVVNLICIGNISYNVVELKILFNLFSLQPLFFFFKTNIKRPFLITVHFLVRLDEGQLRIYTETDYVT